MPAAKALPLPRGQLTETAVHLCIDMQWMFAEQTAWHVPWMKRVLPVIVRVARAFPARTVFTRFIPPVRAADAEGMWRQYYQRWSEFTRERLPPHSLALLPELAELVPPAHVVDKHFYSPFAEPQLHQSLQDRKINSIVITGGETDVCVLAAVLDAVDLGYRVIVASDALCSVSDEAHDNLLQLFSGRFQQQIEVASSETILEAWRYPHDRTHASNGRNEMMSRTIDTAREIYVTGLRNQHAIENQAIELLERQIGRLENYPEMADRMRQHLEESKQQAARIEELLAGLNTSHSTLKDMVTSFMGNVAALGHAPASDEVIKNTFANYAFEHYEIAAYQGLLVVADSAGQQASASVLQQSLKEEQAMAQWIEDHLKPTMLRYIERYAAGETAGR